METKYAKVRRLLREHPDMSPTQIGWLSGASQQYVSALKWRLADPGRNRELQRRRYLRQADAGGSRPSNDVIIADARHLSYDEIAEKDGISRNVAAGVLNRHRSKRGRSAPARVREFA